MKKVLKGKKIEKVEIEALIDWVEWWVNNCSQRFTHLIACDECQKQEDCVRASRRIKLLLRKMVG